jgi:hypothetical protein
MNKFNHNKRQNTAILFELMTKELASATMRSDAVGVRAALSIVKEFFSPGKILRTELDLYRTLLDAPRVSAPVAQQLLRETAETYQGLNKEEILSEQRKLVSKMSNLRKEVFSHFIPNYKSLASIYQIFRKTVKTHDRIILENTLLEALQAPRLNETKEMVPISGLVFKKFLERFNDEYSGLLSEQKDLLRSYILGGTELSVHVNEEIGRLRESLREAKEPELAGDQRRGLVLEMLDSFREAPIGRETIEKILKIQALISEAKSNG